MKKILLCLSLCHVFAGHAEPAKKISICTTLNKAVRKGSSVQKLNRYLDEQWKYWMMEDPEGATYNGFPGQNDRLSDASLETIARHKNEEKCQLDALKKIPAKGLKGEDKINYELAKRGLERGLEGNRFPSELLPLSQLDGVHIWFPDLLMAMPRISKKDYENILSRLDKLPRVIDQHMTLMREGIRRQITPVRAFTLRVPAQFDKLLTAKIEDSSLYLPFKEMPKEISPEEAEALRARAREVISSKVYPAYQKLKSFVVTDYIPHTRESIAMSDLPDGKAWYAFSVKEYTTTDETPDELHELGLKEVERIRHEMEKVRDEAKFKGDLKTFNEFLMKEDRFFYKDAADLLIGYRDIAKRIDPELPKLFKNLPRLTYGVRGMPEYKAEDAPAAYYMPGSLEAGRAGYFEANTSDLPGRPKWAMEDLTLHEAVPGHHLQIAVAQELKGLPDFRRQGGYTAFVEGWGLYAEGLGDQLGVLKDPYSRYGALSAELWRAIRLVVDTGIHAKGWSRQRAIDYFTSLLAKSRKEIEIEVDRYITWPGQALAYKVGQLKFIELRDKAKKELGEKFDIREFHDELLRHGSLPMDVVDKIMNDWITAEKKKK